MREKAAGKRAFGQPFENKDILTTNSFGIGRQALALISNFSRISRFYKRERFNRLTNGEKIIIDNPSKFLQNKINEILKGENMEHSSQFEAPVKFGILEEEKVSRNFYPVKNAPADTVLPKRKTAKSAGYDFVLPCDVRLNPRSISAIIPTNVKVSMPDDEVLMLYIRSSIGIKHHVTLTNGTGIIDADYFSNPDNDGNIGICLQNNSDEIVSFKKGERIMQGIFVKYAVCDSDDTNEVRKGGFGSTGKE